MFPVRMYSVHYLLVVFIWVHTLCTGCPPPLPPPTPSVCHTQCPAGWRLMDSSCYIMVGEPLPWAQAEDRCSELVKEACGQGVSGHLASIYGEAENNFVHFLWRLMGRGDQAIDKYYWIGLSKQAGQLRWTDDSLPVYRYWDTGVEEALETSDNICTYVSAGGVSQKRWNTGDCSNPLSRVGGLPFACELAQNPKLAEPVEGPGPA